MVDWPNPNVEEDKFDPAEGRKRRQLEDVVGPSQRPTHVVRNDSRSGNDEHVGAADRAQAPDPVNQLKGYPPESNSKESRQGTGARCGHPVNRFRMKGRDIMAHLHILRARAEAQQSRIGLALENLFDDRLQRTFVAQVAGAEVSVQADSRGFHGFAYRSNMSPTCRA